jgi:hypothetical protein
MAPSRGAGAPVDIPLLRVILKLIGCLLIPLISLDFSWKAALLVR